MVHEFSRQFNTFLMSVCLSVGKVVHYWRLQSSYEMWHHCKFWRHSRDDTITQYVCRELSPPPGQFSRCLVYTYYNTKTIPKNNFVYIENVEDGFKSQWTCTNTVRVTLTCGCPTEASPPPPTFIPSITDVLPMTTISSTSIKHNFFGRKMIQICHH